MITTPKSSRVKVVCFNQEINSQLTVIPQQQAYNSASIKNIAKEIKKRKFSSGQMFNILRVDKDNKRATTKTSNRETLQELL